MPTYQYQCDKCRHEFEVFHSISAEPVSTCPECAGSVHRLISGGAGFLFRGSGFYTTDYRSEGYKSAEKAEKDSSPKTDTAKPSSGPSSSTETSKAAS